MHGATEPLRLLVEGRPGSGKTTAAARLVEIVRADRVSVTGFLTRELRERGERVGFTLETLDGRRGMLAHVGIRGGPRVGRYGVALDDLERLAIPALRAQADLAVVDELGKIELASVAFRDAVIALLERPVAVVATVHSHPHPSPTSSGDGPPSRSRDSCGPTATRCPPRSPGGCEATGGKDDRTA